LRSRTLLLLLTPLLVLLGCTQDFGVFVPDAASVDAPASDGSGTDGGLDAAKDADASADAGQGGIYQCGTSSVSSCSDCAGMPEPCLYCAADASTAGVCLPMGMSCFGSAPSGFGVCACGMNPNACPAGYQVCRQGNCRTCSDSSGNVGYTCNSGGTCNPEDGGCS